MYEAPPLRAIVTSVVLRGEKLKPAGYPQS